MAATGFVHSTRLNIFRRHGLCSLLRGTRLQPGLQLQPRLNDPNHYGGARSFARPSNQGVASSFSLESDFWRSYSPGHINELPGKWRGSTLYGASGTREGSFSASDHLKSEYLLSGTPQDWSANIHQGGEAHLSSSARPYRRSDGSSKEDGKWGNGTGSGPFNQEHFEDDRYDRYFHQPVVPHDRPKRQAAVERIKHYDDHMRNTYGLFYFLAQHSPSPRPSYRQTSIVDRPNPCTSERAPPFASTTRALRSTFLSSRTPASIIRSSLFSSASTSLKAGVYPAHVRTIASSASLEAGMPILVLPLVAVLKSTATLNVIAVVTRIALTALPLSLRARVMYTARKRYAEDPLSSPAWVKTVIRCIGEATSTQGNAMRFNAILLAPLLALLPVILLGAILIASVERTPVTGRLRVMMLSPTEEAVLVASILAIGEQASPLNDTARDWLAVLQSVLDLPDEGVSPTTGRRLLLGAEVLDERDWRVRWTQAILRTLEHNVPSLSHSEQSLDILADATAGLLRPPPTSYPLTPRSTHDLGWFGTAPSSPNLRGALPGHDVGVEYDLMVLERAESNAFSFGCGPNDAADDGQRKGVIVVYTGFIDEILGNGPIAPPPSPVPASAFSSSSTSYLLDSTPPSTAEVLPTPEQTKALAVLLSHELAHLVLSHTLESYASTALLIPHLSKMFSDVVRTLTFPVVVLLGPFVTEAFARSLNEGASAGFGRVGQAANSCESRKLETEADLVALRLLSHAGIDPRVALDFWQDRLSSSSANLEVDSNPTTSSSSPLHRHSTPTGDPAVGFLRSHPIDEERVELIRAELGRWAAFQGDVFV